LPYLSSGYTNSIATPSRDCTREMITIILFSNVLISNMPSQLPEIFQ